MTRDKEHGTLGDQPGWEQRMDAWVHRERTIVNSQRYGKKPAIRRVNMLLLLDRLNSPEVNAHRMNRALDVMMENDTRALFGDS